jgi:murein DD-endopeptidase MepM/ murein hydrolase activator NlpD
MAVGTKEKPKTASKGYYIWPASGKINSYFGGRHIFGSYSYHSGIDIKVSYGQAIKAADGGTVTFSGWKGTYGKLVIIKHDNGTLTYYAHNSSLLVNAGDKVYQGQTIAKGGSTGRSTGNHCHFEVRVNGTAVNPLNYLS